MRQIFQIHINVGLSGGFKNKTKQKTYFLEIPKCTIKKKLLPK